MIKHETIEKNIGLMILLIIIVISGGGLAEIVPLFFSTSTTKPIEGLRTYTPLEFEGRDIYIREGCNVCHTQMIRPFRAETERYGHFSTANEFVFEYPHLWGSKRTGPDLARVGGRYSDDWHRAHMYNPRDVVPESKMPSYPWLFENKLTGKDIVKKMEAQQALGVPFTNEQIAGAQDAVQGKYEIDALVAYLQALGKMHSEYTNKR
ncbi:cytochrome-c oxidase, cbb3-type subunit II [Neptuniibacter caesariensis]|uniref:Cytochrome c oxidase, cbb3-type, subunit II n=1 Tax=Neptuniibacter caesariensis TaxID=207954 RepID=A0A7U8GST9_NEPCE|nr:cytochrome-c oxidase, cbb3-type subunit II [Neptuniibacter caesariensis]EAR61693.1 cytochrome c oxidase, cbb3-type, subunit II [Neptuniibacter caesariensis]